MATRVTQPVFQQRYGAQTAPAEDIDIEALSDEELAALIASLEGAEAQQAEASGLDLQALLDQEAAAFAAEDEQRELNNLLGIYEMLAAEQDQGQPMIDPRAPSQAGNFGGGFEGQSAMNQALNWDSIMRQRNMKEAQNVAAMNTTQREADPAMAEVRQLLIDRILGPSRVEKASQQGNVLLEQARNLFSNLMPQGSGQQQQGMQMPTFRSLSDITSGNFLRP